MASLAAVAEPKQANLEVHTDSGATTFHIGERIPLQLDYTAPPELHIFLDMATYDRSGRMPYETFAVSPSSSAKDPLKAYFGSSDGSTMGGLSSPPEELSARPITLHMDLNQWVRFDQPGEYAITVRSTRASRSGAPFLKDQINSASSNSLHLRIIPATATWQKATLTRALQSFAEPPNPNAPVTPQRSAAIADIRYLATPAAIATMVANLDDEQRDCSFEFGFGLVGLPPALHDLAIRKLKQTIDDPNTAVSDWQLNALSVLQLDPNAPQQQPGQARARARARNEAVRLALAALPRKSGLAQVRTANLLTTENVAALNPAEQATLAQVLASHFDQLSPEQQTALLSYRWSSVRDTLTTAQLQLAASLPITDAGSHEMASFNREALKSAALYRWYQRDPAAAKQLLLDQLRSSKPAFTANALWFLPNDPMPEQEALWAEALFTPGSDADSYLLVPLMARFGTGAYTTRMASELRTFVTNNPCGPRTDALAYLVRFDPASAAPYLNATKTPENGCHNNLFTDLARFTSNDNLKAAAIAAVRDADTQTATDAARYLAEYGDSLTRSTLLNRYRAWSAQWTGRAGELNDPSPAKGPERYQQIGLGQVLAQALLANQGWIPDAQLSAEVLKLCVGEQVCQTVQGLAQETPKPVPVNFTSYVGGFFLNVGHFQVHSLRQLGDKLSQYPQGTQFTLAPVAPTSDDRLLAQKVQAAFQEAGLTLTPESTAQ